MSIFTRLRVVRTTLVIGVAMRALAWGIAAGLTLFAGAALVDTMVAVSLRARTALLAVAIVSMVIVAGVSWWRDRTVLSLDRVALWIEEHFPSLEFLLVRAVETKNEALVPATQTSAWVQTARTRAARS